MTDADVGFRVVLVGGFQKEDVLDYIAKQTKEHTERQESLQNTIADLTEQLTNAKQKAAEDGEQIERLVAKNSELLERLGNMTMQIEKLQSLVEQQDGKLTMAEQETEAQNERYQELSEKLRQVLTEYQSLQEKQDALIAENTEYTQQLKEYEHNRAYLTDLELNAHRRAEEVKQQATQKAQEIVEQAEQKAEQIRLEMQKTCADYQHTLRSTQAAANAAREQTERILEKLATLELFDEQANEEGKEQGAESGTEPMQKSGILCDMLNNLRSKVGEKEKHHGAL